MNGHAVASGNELTEEGVKSAEAHAHHEPAIKELDVSKLTVHKTTNPRKVPELDSKEVWAMKSCTDHMVMVTWTADEGWHAPEIKPYGPLQMSPIASCLHYATECFEGMKVYRGYDGKLRLFRPERNCKRLNLSAARVALPAFDALELEKLIKALMAIDGSKWLPISQPGNFLYLRPALIGNGEQIGVVPPSEALLFIVAVAWPDLATSSPPGAPPRTPGLKLLASKNDIRAWPGGFGHVKVGANYGPAFVSHMEGRKLGYDQILWLLGSDFQVTEAGASNFFVIWKTKEGTVQLVTAPLGDKIILEGVTRGGLLELASTRLAKGSDYLTSKLQELEVVERKFTMLELAEAQKEGRVIECFVAGTAYFVTPVSAINFQDEELDIPMGNGDGGHYALEFRKWLGDIMYGNVQHPWGVIIDEE